jgi:mono/diheme cytochrome c family protein
MSRAWSVALLAALPLPLAAQEKVSRADLKPGLVFTARDVVGQEQAASVSRIEPTVGLTLAANETPHPRLRNGAAMQWQGYVNVLQPGKYRFDATLHGTVTVTVGGTTTLDTFSDDPAGKRVSGPEVTLAAGWQPFVVSFSRRPDATAARLDLFWQGPGFRPEPIPHQALGHLPKQRPTSFAADREQEHGRFLVEELACVRCHTAGDHPVGKTLADRGGPSLTDIARRVYPGWLDAWLADPHALRPDTTMPKLFADDATGKAERYAVVSYLMSLGGSVPEAKVRDRGEAGRSVAAGKKLYLLAGCAACHGEQLTQRTQPKAKDDEDAKPPLDPADSAYSLGTAGPTSPYLLGALGSKTSAVALAQFLRDPLAVSPHGRMPNMALKDDEARDLARFLCQQTDDRLTKAMPPEPATDPADLLPEAADPDALRKRPKAERWRTVGRTLLTAKGCVNCHEVKPGGNPLPAEPAFPPLADLAKHDPGSGCLGDSPMVRRAPVFHLTPDQRNAVTAFLRHGLAGAGTRSPAYQARVALRRFNCLACHQRDGEGGLPDDLAASMKLLESTENADDVAPPRLTGVGHKLRSSWMKKVLTEAARGRPWMTLRMPQYGRHNVGFLTDALPNLEGAVADDTLAKPPLTAGKVETGRQLAGKAGHGCVACHDISGVVGGGTRGPDLARTHDRVRFDWYTRWMHQPQRLAPGTKMPTYFENGKAMLRTVADGDADAHIDALWAYFTLGPGLPLPAGMDPPRGLIVGVGDRPTVLRTFMPDGAGTRPVAVGYPGGVNLVFDAAGCRVASAWTGNFLDASPVWTNRGGGAAKLLGPGFLNPPAGFPWAVTTGDTPPDFATRATDPAFGHQLPDDGHYPGPRRVRFGGYELDGGGFPTFRYTLTGADGNVVLAVADRPEPVPVTAAAGVRRTFSLDRPTGGTVWLLAATGTGEPRRVGGKLVVPDGDRATVLQASAGDWRTVAAGERRLVLLRLPPGDRATKLTLTVWGLPRDDDGLAGGLK